jgi:hypothetical protein
MRFSLKWILAGTVYVALAAAAFGTGKWYFAEVLWALTLLAVVYAIVAVAYFRRRRQAAALGFAVASACFLLCLMRGAAYEAAWRLVVACGAEPIVLANTTSGYPVIDEDSLSVYIRAACAVATLAFGLMGSLVGLLAFRAAQD